MDLVPDPHSDNLTALTRLLEELDGRVQVEGGSLPSTAIGTFLRAGDRALVSTELGELDVLQGLPQLPAFSELERDGREADVGGMRVLVCSLEALLAMKRASTRPRDRDDLDALEAAHSPSDE